MSFPTQEFFGPDPADEERPRHGSLEDDDEDDDFDGLVLGSSAPGEFESLSYIASSSRGLRAPVTPPLRSTSTSRKYHRAPSQPTTARLGVRVHARLVDDTMSVRSAASQQDTLSLISKLPSLDNGSLRSFALEVSSRIPIDLDAVLDSPCFHSSLPASSSSTTRDSMDSDSDADADADFSDSDSDAEPPLFWQRRRASPGPSALQSPLTMPSSPTGPLKSPDRRAAHRHPQPLSHHPTQPRSPRSLNSPPPSPSQPIHLIYLRERDSLHAAARDLARLTSKSRRLQDVKAARLSQLRDDVALASHAVAVARLQAELEAFRAATTTTTTTTTPISTTTTNDGEDGEGGEYGKDGNDGNGGVVQRERWASSAADGYDSDDADTVFSLPVIVRPRFEYASSRPPSRSAHDSPHLHPRLQFHQQQHQQQSSHSLRRRLDTSDSPSRASTDSGLSGLGSPFQARIKVSRAPSCRSRGGGGGGGGSRPPTARGWDAERQRGGLGRGPVSGHAYAHRSRGSGSSNLSCFC